MLRKYKLLFAAILSFTVLSGILMYSVITSNRDNSNEIIVHIDVPEVEAVLPTMTQYYSATAYMTQEEFQSFYASTSVGMSQQFVANSSPTMKIHADENNKLLYEIADKYFICYYGNQRVSPIFSMALSNVETPGRADPNKSWCALIPTRYVDVSRALEFNVVNVYDSDDIKRALTTEYSTRDRGCLQMSPTYGTSNSYFNSLMSGNEKDKLHGKTDEWAKGASSNSGDRFYLPDVLLRLSAAMQGQVDAMAKNGYSPTTDAQLICMLAISHQSSGIWSSSNHNKKIGCWVSGQKAFEWCSLISDQNFIDILTEYAKAHSQTYIDSSTAKQLWTNYTKTTVSEYGTKDVVLYYPIKVLYSYIKLTQLYTQ